MPCLSGDEQTAMADPIELCRYHYDPLDRLAARTPLAQAITQRFYKDDQLATEIQGAEQRTFLQAGDPLLAQKNQVGGVLSNALMTTDQQSSVLNAVTAEQHLRMAYSPYGHRDVVDAVPGLPGFNGEHPDPMTGHYLLGNGYRAYNPVLMRFNSPDSLSPFGEGGLNPYAYCIGDPINSRDPTGHKADRNKILGFVWVGVGFAGAALGLYAAVPAMKAVTKALKSGAPVPTAQMLTTVGATAQVVASTAFTANRIINEVKPGSPALEPLMWVAVGFGVPSLGLRISAQVTTKVAQRAAAAQARTATRRVIDENARVAFEWISGIGKGVSKPSNLAGDAKNIRLDSTRL